jgi:CHASE2 domain-containing sensor protein
MLVAIKETPQLTARLSAARARVAAIKLKLKMRDMPETVVDETTGRPYNEHTYRHLFAEVRALAIQGSNEHALAPCPSLAFVNERTGAPDFKHDQDLRDTCVMLLDRAGNDLLSICDVTGHSYQSAQLIMKHYRARNAARAGAAIDRLVAFISREGLA